MRSKKDRDVTRRALIAGGVGAAALWSCDRATPAAAGARDVSAFDSLGAVADAIVARALGDDKIPGASFIAFDAKGRTAARHWGVADREAERLVDDATVWPLASVTKILTAAAALTLVDATTLSLDDEVAASLGKIRIPDHPGPAVALRHLLSHTAGFDEVRGRLWDSADAMPSLAEFLNGGKLIRIRQAGDLTAYSSYGIALASALVEEASGGSYEDYVADVLFAPLGMESARYVRRREDASGVAAPYDIEDGVARRREHELYVTSGSSSAVATVGDIAKFGAMLLRGGESDAGRRVLSHSSAAGMLEQQATAHPQLPGWSLGMQMDRRGDVLLAEHGGDIGGFSCLLTLAPALDVGFFTVNHGEGHDLRFDVRDAVLDKLSPFTPVSPPAADEVSLADYVGGYRSTLDCLSCGDEGAGVFDATEKDGALSLWGRTWIAAGDDYFLRDDGARGLGFKRDAGGRVYAVTGGAWRVMVKSV